MRTATTLGVLTILMLLGVVLGWTWLTAPFPSLGGSGDEERVAVCIDRKVPAGATVKPAMVTVTVANAGTTDGLAGTVLGLLEERGFYPADSTNAPAGSDVRKVQVLADDPSGPAARLVAAQFGRKVEIRQAPASAIGPGVVVLVGDGFKDLRAGAPKSVKAKSASTVCRPNPDAVAS